MYPVERPRWTWVVACAVVLAGSGCELVFPPAGVPGDARRGTDGGGADADPDDPDGDSVPDGEDNCPHVANPDQHNEDGDTDGDVCDLCPGIFDSNRADGDSDGIGDACDPAPCDPHDVPVAFAAFTSIPGGWATDSTLSTDGESLIVAGTGDLIGPEHGAYGSVRARVQLDSKQFAVELRAFEQAPRDAVRCGLDPSSGTIALTIGDSDMPAARTTETGLTLPITVDLALAILPGVSGTEARCSVTQLTGVTAGDLLIPDLALLNVDSVGTRAGIRGTAANAAVRWLFVTGRDGSGATVTVCLPG